MPGTEYLYGVGCAADGDCLLAGVNSVGTHNFGAGVLVPYGSGKPLTAHVVPGTNGLGQTICSGSLGDCVSAGAAIGR